MQGHGYAQPVKQPPPTGWLVFVRVFFVVISVFSIGLLSWTMLLRLAIVTRKTLDWSLMVAALAAEVLGLVLLGSEPGDEIHTVGGWTGLALLLGTLVIVISYYLAADVRHFHQLRFAAYAPRQQPPAPAYGYPQPQQPPYTATTVPQTMAPAPPIPQPQPRMPQPPVPAEPPQQRPAPARIDQVRAELDELSDYLRKRESNHEGNPEGGR
ncbi:hypothetical protein [Streptomyces sp. SD15]